jgi:hypothetical protein
VIFTPSKFGDSHFEGDEFTGFAGSCSQLDFLAVLDRYFMLGVKTYYLGF